MLTREQILNRYRDKKLVTETVPAPELGEGETLLVKKLKAAEVFEITARAKAQPDLMYAHWIVACVVDESGKPIFTAEDAAALGDEEFSLVERLMEVATRLTGANKEQAVKN